MKYTSKERLQIGQLVYTRQLLEAEACLKYGISRTCIQNYVRAFKKENGITIVTRCS
jgi:transposase